MHIINLGCSLLLSESRATINDLDVILRDLMLQIIYIKVFRVKRFSDIGVQLNSLSFIWI